MGLDRTQPIDIPVTRHLYRCACGTNVEIDSRNGGVCVNCMRQIPGAVTRYPLSMTLAAVIEVEKQPELAGKDDAADSLTGKRLGHFEIIEPLGSGGMGKVYRALDTSLQRYVAVKIISNRHARSLDNAGRDRLLYEAIAQARVNHPNIVTIYYVALDGEVPFLAMELIDGGDVAGLIGREPIPYETLCRIAIKITHALDVASEMGIVHSDIKPQNLLLLPNGDVKLSDFGMARLTDDPLDRTTGGTPNYLAPEVLDGGKPTLQSDMYALGVTLYEMTFGCLPVALSGTTPAEWSQIHHASKVQFPAQWPEHLPVGWKHVLERLLAKNPQDRYRSYQELGQELHTILPQPSANAPRVARVIAWAIDALTIILLTIPIIVLGQVVSGILPYGLAAPLGIISWLSLLIALSGYTAIVGWWKQSLGRELLNIHVVNRFGLPAGRRTMVTRTILRLMLFWCIGIGTIINSILPISSTWLPLLFIVAGIAWLIVDGALLLAPNSISLHDRLTLTRAVIGQPRWFRERA